MQAPAVQAPTVQAPVDLDNLQKLLDAARRSQLAPPLTPSGNPGYYTANYNRADNEVSIVEELNASAGTVAPIPMKVDEDELIAGLF